MTIQVTWARVWPIISLVVSMAAVSLTQAADSSGSNHICTDSKGRKLFSQTPCPKGQESALREYKIQEPAGGAAAQSMNGSMSYEALRDSNRKYELQRLLKKNRAALKKLEQNKDSKLRAMRENLLSTAGPNARNRASSLYEQLKQAQKKYVEQMVQLKKTIHSQEQELHKLQ